MQCDDNIVICMPFSLLKLVKFSFLLFSYLLLVLPRQWIKIIITFSHWLMVEIGHLATPLWYLLFPESWSICSCCYNTGCLPYVSYRGRVLHLLAGYCTDPHGCETIDLLAQKLVKCW